MAFPCPLNCHYGIYWQKPQFHSTQYFFHKPLKRLPFATSVQYCEEVNAYMVDDSGDIGSTSLSIAHQLPLNFTPNDLFGLIRRQKSSDSVFQIFSWASNSPSSL